MSKHIPTIAIIVLLLASWQPVLAQKKKQGTTATPKTDLKFLDDITISVPRPESNSNIQIESKVPAVEPQFASNRKEEVNYNFGTVEKASSIQFKYALLLDMEVEQIQNLHLFRVIDEWLGTRYKLGGSNKDGIDCSAFMQVMFSALYGISLPRTAREQYHLSKRISRTELKEGDLVFFNTTGGVSHVGMYLQNNKFVHASSSGVTISDLFDDYWMRKLVGVGRIEGLPLANLTSQP